MSETEELEQPTEERIKELLDRKAWTELRDVLETMLPPEIAELLMDLEEQGDRVLLFRSMPRPLSNEVFGYLEPEDQINLLTDLSNEESRHLLASLSPDDRTHLFEEMPGLATQRLLNLLSAEDLAEVRHLLGYPEDSVGRLMTPDYLAVRPDWTIERALRHIRIRGKDKETINVIYVVDPQWRLIDALGLKKFVMADPEESVQDVMDDSFVSLSAFDDRERAVEIMQRYDLAVLPVVDSDGVLVGIVTFDDVMDVATAEVTEDFQKVGAMAPLRKSFLEAGIGVLYRKRIGWLMALVFMNLLSGAAIHAYEGMIEQVAALVIFLPLLIASGGNAGSQSATLIIRGLATGDVDPTDWLKLLVKELFVATALGVSLAFAVFWIGLWRGGAEMGFALGQSVGYSMIVVVLVGSTIGLLLPFILDRVKQDPAAASVPLITVLCDISGVIIYFSIAKAIMGI
jgi:magnesium transporter